MQKFEIETRRDWLDFVTLVDDLTYDFKGSSLPLISAALEKMSSEDIAEQPNRLQDLVEVSDYAISSIEEHIPSMNAANMSQGQLERRNVAGNPDTVLPCFYYIAGHWRDKELRSLYSN